MGFLFELENESWSGANCPSITFEIGLLTTHRSCKLHNSIIQQIFLTSANIFQTIQYITKNKVMETESRELAAISRGKIRAGSTDDWKSEQLFVPPLPPTNLRGCHLIRIQYDVFVSSDKCSTILTVMFIVFSIFS